MLRWGLLVAVVGCSSNGNGLFAGATTQDAGAMADRWSPSSPDSADPLERDATMDSGATQTTDSATGASPWTDAAHVGAGDSASDAFPPPSESGPPPICYSWVDGTGWGCGPFGTHRTERACAPGELPGTITGDPGTCDAGPPACSLGIGCAIGGTVATGDACAAPESRMTAAEQCIGTTCDCSGCVLTGTGGTEWCAAWRSEMPACEASLAGGSIERIDALVTALTKYCGN